MDSSTDLDEHYACADGGSCTSSPVYAELDGCVTHIPQGQLLATHTVPLPLMVAGPAQSISPYSVGLHTYSEVAEAVRMAALGSSTALLPDACYDNTAYLPSAQQIPDHYGTRSLRRGHRAATLAQLGSATPLLTSHHHLNQPPTAAYLTSGRVSKKPRPPFAQQLTRGSLQRMHDEIDLQHERPRYASRRQGQGIYSDLSLRQSPSLTTFKSASPFTYRDNPKRPLPPVPHVPGVRL